MLIVLRVAHYMYCCSRVIRMLFSFIACRHIDFLLRSELLRIYIYHCVFILLLHLLHSPTANRSQWHYTIDLSQLYSLSLLPWLLGQPSRFALPARVPINAPTNRNTVRTVNFLSSLDLPGSVKIALRHILIFDMLDALHVAFSVN